MKRATGPGTNSVRVRRVPLRSERAHSTREADRTRAFRIRAFVDGVGDPVPASRPRYLDRPRRSGRDFGRGVGGHGGGHDVRRMNRGRSRLDREFRENTRALRGDTVQMRDTHLRALPGSSQVSERAGGRRPRRARLIARGDEDGGRDHQGRPRHKRAKQRGAHPYPQAYARRLAKGIGAALGVREKSRAVGLGIGKARGRMSRGYTHTTKGCFGCGVENEVGLDLRPYHDGDGFAAEFRPKAHHRGFSKVVHGGIIAAGRHEGASASERRSHSPNVSAPCSCASETSGPSPRSTTRAGWSSIDAAYFRRTSGTIMAAHLRPASEDGTDEGGLRPPRR
jgi:hypothetical protein